MKKKKVAWVFFFSQKKKWVLPLFCFGERRGNMFFKVAVSFGFGTASKDGPKDGEAAAALHGKGGEKTWFFPSPLCCIFIYFCCFVRVLYCILYCLYWFVLSW